MNKTLSGRRVVAYESLTTKEKSSWVRFSLQGLSHSSYGVSQRWSQLELVAFYESARNESFDCI